MADLALEGVHGLKLLRLTGRTKSRNCLVSEVLKISLTIGTEARNIEHQTRTLAGLGLDGKAREFLKGVDNFAIFANKVIQSRGIFRNDFY